MEDNRPYKIPRPKGLTGFIHTECARHHYMFFSTKLNKAMCSCCGTEYDLERLPRMAHEPQNGKNPIFCPECKTYVTPKDMRYGRKKLKDYGRVTWTRGCGPVTFIETDIYIIDYETPYPRIGICPDQQIRISKKDQKRYDWHGGQWGTGWSQVKKIGLKVRPKTTWGYSYCWDHMYMPDDVVSVGTDLQYADLSGERFFDQFGTGNPDQHDSIDWMIGYMSDFTKYPATEILEKSGFEILVLNRAAGHRCKHLNMRAKDLRKILKLDGADVKALRKEGPTIHFFRDLHDIRKKAPWAKVEDITALSDIMGRFVETRKMEMIEEHVDLSKLLKKILEEVRATGDHFTLGDYADYLEAVIRLGRRLDKKTLYPKNLVEEHDAVIEEAERNKKYIDAANFRKFQKEITGMSEPFILGELMIRPAKSPQELRKESQVLNHCVRTYIDRVARGETSILFIRETEKPDTPFFTLELNKKGNIVQCRGDHNRSCPEEVGHFIEEWKTQWDREMKRA